MNWTKGLLRLWLVASLLWAVPVGWLTWPGDAPQEYLRYWYCRVAHPEILKERRDNEAAAGKQQDAALAAVRERYDGTRKPLPRELTLDDLKALAFNNLEFPHHGREKWVITKEERDEVREAVRA